MIGIDGERKNTTLKDFLGSEIDIPDYLNMKNGVAINIKEDAVITSNLTPMPEIKLELKKAKAPEMVSISINEEPTMVEEIEPEEKQEDTQPALAYTTIDLNSTPQNAYSIPLSLSKDSIEIVEFENSVYKYQRVNLPDGTVSPYHACYHKNARTGKWSLWHHLLSNKYNILKFEEFTKTFVRDYKLDNKPSIVHEPFYLTWEVETDNQISYFSDDTDEMFFTMMTGLEPSYMKEVNSNVGVLLINSYNGTFSFNLHYVVSLKTKGKETRTLYKDYFILQSEKLRFIHKGANNTIHEELNVLQDKVKKNIDLFRNYTEDMDEFIELMSKSMGRVCKKQFGNLCSKLAGSQKNFLYICSIASKCLTENYSVVQYGKLGPVVRTVMNKIIQKEGI